MNRVTRIWLSGHHACETCDHQHIEPDNGTTTVFTSHCALAENQSAHCPAINPTETTEEQPT